MHKYCTENKITNILPKLKVIHENQLHCLPNDCIRKLNYRDFNRGHQCDVHECITCFVPLIEPLVEIIKTRLISRSL